MTEMETRSEPNLRFTYFFYDPYLSYEGVHSIDGRTFVPDYLDQQKHRLGNMLCANSSDYYRRKYEAGDGEVIFEYATESRVCFQSPWVTDQIEEWRIKNNRESRKKLKKLFQCYLGEQRGRTPPKEIKEIIRKDQTIFYEIVKLKKKSQKISLEKIIGMVANKFWPEDTELKKIEAVWLVYKKYKKVADQFKGSDTFKDEMDFIRYFKKTPFDVIWERSLTSVMGPLGLDFRCSRCQKKIVRKFERKSLD